MIEAVYVLATLGAVAGAVMEILAMPRRLAWWEFYPFLISFVIVFAVFWPFVVAHDLARGSMQ